MDPADSRDLTCPDFSSRADAQLNLDLDTSDPFGLDVDLDGIAGETQPITSTKRDIARAQQAQRENHSHLNAAATPEPDVMPEEPGDMDCIAPVTLSCG